MKRSFVRCSSAFALLSLLAVSGCILGPSNGSGSAPFSKAEAAKTVKITGEPTAFYDASWADSSGKDGKGGVRLVFSPGNRKVLPLRTSNFDRHKKGDASLKKRGDWLLFHGSGDQSLSFEWEWVTTAQEKYWGLTWAGAGVAFNPSWAAVDLSSAKYLVLYAKTSHPNGEFDIKVGLQSMSKAKGSDQTGKVSLREYIEGKALTGNWARAVIPLSAFPDVDKVDLTKTQTVRFDLDGHYPENERVQVLLDDIYASDLEMVTPVENVGYLVQDDSVVFLWDKRPGEKVRAFSFKCDGKELGSAAPGAREFKAPLAAFGEGKKHTVSLYTLGESETSSPIELAVNLAGSLGETVTVTLDGAPAHEISPYVFGSNYAPPATIKEAGITINRWGGNGTSKYNYKNDLSSAGSDWYFLNTYSKPDGSPEQEKGYYTFIKDTLGAGAQVNFTIPMLSYVAKPHPDQGGRYCSFPLSVYKDQDKNDGQGCGNGMKPGGKEPIWDNDPTIAMIPNSPDFQKGLVESIKKNFGGASAKGVKFYSLDNEPGLWNSTHRDVEPRGVTAEQLADRSEAYARMIKTVDPDAKVIGFSSWGVMELAGSNADYTPPGADGYKTYNKFKDESERWSERKKHGDESQLEYLLNRFKEAEKKAGKRLIDVIDVHWYPEVYGKDSKGDTKRLSENGLVFDAVATPKQFEATREWWDPTFKPSGGLESWTANAENGPKMWDPYHPVIPALKKIIEQNYPGTKLAINEYATGSNDHYPGALLRAAVLGIFMQEDLYMAQTWYQVDSKSYLYYAQKLFGNFDGKGSRVKGRFIKTKSTSGDLMSYAAKDGNSYYVVLVNKNERQSLPTTLKVPSAVRDVQTYQLAESLSRRLYGAKRSATGSDIKLTVPAFSAMLVVMK